MGTWNSRDRETVSGTDFGDRMGVVADSSRNPLSTRSIWRATGADGAGFARRYWLSPNSANAWPLQKIAGRAPLPALSGPEPQAPSYPIKLGGRAMGRR